MNTMQDFYVTIFSKDKLKDDYLKVLSDLTKIDRMQIKALESDLAWQTWDETQTEPQAQA